MVTCDPNNDGVDKRKRTTRVNEIVINSKRRKRIGNDDVFDPRTGKMTRSPLLSVNYDRAFRRRVRRGDYVEERRQSDGDFFRFVAKRGA